MRTDDGLVAALEAHDDAVARAHLDLWLGGEPTFTRADRVDACWLTQAEGGDKEPTARAWVLAFAERLKAGVLGAPLNPTLVRALGRHYPGEATPRFAYGVAWRADGTPPELEGATGLPANLAVGLDAAPCVPPAPDAALSWLTATPDPGVLEINMAPTATVGGYYRQSVAIFEAAQAVGLSTTRRRWNGEVGDSGGGGQLTFGGPTPAQSPFFTCPSLLPSLLRYLNHHPALSYWFASECVGSASQGPRPDEGSRERFEELALVLDHLDQSPVTPAALWSHLAPLLVDGSGNAHRAEVNVEKLCNVGFGTRGTLGLAELRSLRMMADPETQACVAALFRAVLARCATAPLRAPLIDFGAALHDRFALPAFLEADLRAVLADLAHHGLGLGHAITARLLAHHAPLVSVERGGARLTVRPALEFWPLVDDVASQERSGARTVDASIRRVEVALTGAPNDHVSACGFVLPLTTMGETRVAGVRYRAYVPNPGFAPNIAANDPLELTWHHGEGSTRIRLYSWKRGGGGYTELPATDEEAARRRAARVQVEPLSPPAPPAAGSDAPRAGTGSQRPAVAARWVPYGGEAPGDTLRRVDVGVAKVTVDVRGAAAP